MMPAPMLVPAASMAAGIWLDRACGGPSTIAWCSLAIPSGLLAIAGVRRGAGWALAALAIAFAAFGGGWHHRRWSDLDPLDLARGDWSGGRIVLIRGVMTDVPAYRPGSMPGDEGITRSFLAATSLGDGRGNWRPASGRLQLAVPGDRTDLAMGDPVEAAGILREVEGPLNPGEVDFRDILRAEGVRLRLMVAGPRSIAPDPDRPDWPLHRWLGRARESARRRLADRLDPDASALASALLLGRREAVDPVDNDAFARTGTTHLLAISGLHLQVLAALAWSALRLVGLGRKPAFWSVALASGLYATLVGWMPSVARSVAMTGCGCAAGLSDRPMAPSNALAAAALATMGLNPSFLFDVGCQLSFLGVAALGWSIDAFGRFRGRLRPIDAAERAFEPAAIRAMRAMASAAGMSLWCSIAVWLATLPLVVYAFHVVPTAGILLNVPLVPITSVALVASGLTLAIAAVSGPIASAPAWACSACRRLTLWLVRGGAAIPWGHRFEPGPPAWWVLVFYALLAWSLFRRRFSWMLRWLAIGAALVLATPAPHATEADVLAVGHGLSVAVYGADGRVLLYDCGRLGYPRVGRSSIAPALWSRGVRRLDAVALSHADSDHYNGLDDLLDRFEIGEVRIPPGFGGPSNPEADALVERIRARGVPLVEMAAGDSIAIGDARAKALHPPAGWRPDAPDNGRCLVIAVESLGRRLLLTGDIEGVGLDRLIRSGEPGGFDAVLSPHHGGRAANPPAFYRWADPGQVLVSQARPQPGSADVVATSAGERTPIRKTWEQGAITLRWDADGIVAAGLLQARARFEPGPWLRYASSLLGILASLAAGIALAAVVFGSWFLVSPGRTPEANGDLSGEWQGGWNPIEIRAADGTALGGSWMPASIDSDGPYGWVLLLHGMGEDGRALADRGAFMASLGWHVLRPDSRGLGRSGGQFLSYGARESADVRAWIDVLPMDADAPVVLWGRSMGAAIALKAAVEDDRVMALILEAPYADLTRSVALGLRRKRVPGVLAPWVVRRAESLAGIRFAHPSPIELAPRFVRPSLILIGRDDPIAPPGSARELASKFAARPELLEVEGAGHADVFDGSGEPGRRAILALLDRVRERGQRTGEKSGG
ncbi:MAG: ComEC/Rec2 family competence protein [Isosphaeraceae bacterium]